MGASRSQYATPYGAYGPRQGQVPNRNVYGGGPRPAYAAPAYGGMVGASNQNAAYRLDAADGVIDGRYFGSPVAVTRPTYVSQGPTYMRSAPVYGGYRAPTYVAQPSFQQPIFASAPTYAAPPMMAAPAYAPAYAAAPVSYAPQVATSYASPLMSYGAPAIAAPSFGSAFQLDAADGVLDGRFFGTQLAVAGPQYAGPQYAGPQYAVPSFAPAFAPGGYAPGLVAAPTQGAAFALDASDGVIDGRYFGSQVAVAAPVQQFAPAYNPGVVAAPSQGAAFALDAADGLIDGRYFGAQVGVAAPAYTGY